MCGIEIQREILNGVKMGGKQCIILQNIIYILFFFSESYEPLCFSQELKDRKCLVLVSLLRLPDTQPLKLDPPASNPELA